MRGVLVLLALLVASQGGLAGAGRAGRAADGDATGAAAETGAAEDRAPGAEQASPPGASRSPELDRLLRPRLSPAAGTAPAGYQRGGRDREEWREQFDSLQSEIRTLEAMIAGKQEKMREASDGGYQFAPPGAGAPTDPAVLQLRAELKRDRTTLETSRRRLRELEIEASLAGVPRDWIE